MPSHKYGDVRDDGYIYTRMTKQADGKSYEQWLSPSAFRRNIFCQTVAHAKQRAKREGVAHNITAEHLQSIYPADGRCPVLHIPLVFGSRSGLQNSPSLDRRDPAKGYTVGNVSYMSKKANSLKGNMSLSEIKRLVAHLEGLSDEVA